MMAVMVRSRSNYSILVQASHDPTKFTLRFGGKGNDINAATYGAILINTVTILEEANKELHTGAQIEIRVQQEREGSYVVDLAINSLAALGALSPMLTPENIEIAKETAKKIVGVATGGYKAWKALMGEKPVEVKVDGDNVVIVTGNNNKVIVDIPTSKLVLENKRSQNAFSDSFQTLDKDKSVHFFEILDDRTLLFEVDGDEFSRLGKKMPRTLPEKQSETESIHLNIIRPSFDPALVSDFVYRGIRIPATITDPGFWERVDRGERFAKGDILFVDLEIGKVLNKSLNAYENKTYTITQVHSHIPRPEQPDLLENA